VTDVMTSSGTTFRNDTDCASLSTSPRELPREVRPIGEQMYRWHTTAGTSIELRVEQIYVPFERLPSYTRYTLTIDGEIVSITRRSLETLVHVTYYCPAFAMKLQAVFGLDRTSLYTAKGILILDYEALNPNTMCAPGTNFTAYWREPLAWD
jgi:hypothetical protein